jgi:hypothetical protein
VSYGEVTNLGLWWIGVSGVIQVALTILTVARLETNALMTHDSLFAQYQ